MRVVGGAALLALASGCGGGGDAGPGDGGGGGLDASVAASTCGSTDLLRDDFLDADPDRLRWVPFNFGPGIAPAITDGHAVLSFADDDATGAPGFISARRYRLDESQLAIDAGGVIDVANVETRIYHSQPGNALVGFRVANGLLEAQRRLPGEEDEVLDSVTYSPDDHRFWRMREAGDELFFETSADGVAWDEMASTDSTPFAHPGLLVFLIVESATEAGSIWIDAVNKAGALTDPGWCPIQQLSDDFDDPAVADVWAIESSGTGCTVEEVDGLLELANPNAAASCGYVTALGQILSGEAVWVAAAEPADGTPDLTFGVQLGVGGDRIVFHHTAVALQLLRLDPGEKPADAGAEILLATTFDAEAHRYWRFRDDDGALALEVSPDASDWNTLHTIDDAATADVFVRLETTRPGASVVAFDDLRRGP